ncbi:MAG: hypothetical protein H0T73_03320, partial [Ardenticatenales bacterium]|nr:hypothetical protein [Ardenticatenales bacterium]
MVNSTTSFTLTERGKLFLVLAIALFQGLLYMFLLPPWQHYDEPTHFEYAWLLANRSGLPERGDEEQLMRREVAASMVAHHFYWNLTNPDLLTDVGRIYIGISELPHPPVYYLLVSLPLRLARHLDFTTQLYLARSVSLLMFLLIILIGAYFARSLTGADHPLRWLLPLCMALLPPFVNQMTAV